MQYQDLGYRIHARQSMFMRSISDEGVEHIIHNGEVTGKRLSQIAEKAVSEGVQVDVRRYQAA